jgi:ribosomal protein S18 acetylase RimI-like enzyme
MPCTYHANQSLIKKESIMLSEPRLYREISDLDKIRQLLVAGRKANKAAYYVHSGDLNWWLFYLDQDFHNRLYLWENLSDGEITGWALFSPRFGAFDVFAHPDLTHSTLRLEMWQWAEQLMLERYLQPDEQQISTMWVSENDYVLINHLLARRYICRDQHLMVLHRPLDTEILTGQLPSGFQVRYVSGEHEANLRAECSHAAFESSRPLDAYTSNYLRFMRSPVYTPEFDLIIAAPDGRFAAFCIAWLDPANQSGYFEPVGVHPDFRRLGLGKAVLQAGLRLMQKHGMVTANVCVESHNPTAQKLYQALGFQPIQKLLTFTLNP